MIFRDGMLYAGCLYAAACAVTIEAHAIAAASWSELLTTIVLAVLQ